MTIWHLLKAKRTSCSDDFNKSSAKRRKTCGRRLSACKIDRRPPRAELPFFSRGERALPATQAGHAIHARGSVLISPPQCAAEGDFGCDFLAEEILYFANQLSRRTSNSPSGARGCRARGNPGMGAGGCRQNRWISYIRVSVSRGDAFCPARTRTDRGRRRAFSVGRAPRRPHAND